MRKLGPLFDPTLTDDGGRVVLAGDVTGPSDASVVDTLTGAAGVVTLPSGSTIVQTQPATTPAETIGTADITNAALYGVGGMLNGLTLRLNVDQQGLSTLVFNGATNTATKATLFAAIVAKVAWAGIGAAQGGTGGNKLDLTAPLTIVIDVASTALAALGLVAGLYSYTAVNEDPIVVRPYSGNPFSPCHLETAVGYAAHEIDNTWSWGLNAVGTDPALPGAGLVVEDRYNNKYETYFQHHAPGFAHAVRFLTNVFDVTSGVSSVAMRSAIISIGSIENNEQDTIGLNLSGQFVATNGYVSGVQTPIFQTYWANAVVAFTDVDAGVPIYGMRMNAAGSQLFMQANGAGGFVQLDGGRVVLSTGNVAKLVVDTSGNVGLFSAAPSVGNGVGVLGIADAGTIPTTNPVGGGALYSSSSQGAWRRSDGTVIGFG